MGGEVDRRVVAGHGLSDGCPVKQIHRDRSGAERLELVVLCWASSHGGYLVTTRDQLRNDPPADDAAGSRDEDSQTAPPENQLLIVLHPPAHMTPTVSGAVQTYR